MLKELYREVFGADPGEIEVIASSGSSRRNYRVYRNEALGEDTSVPESVIFTEGQSVAENNAFIQLARYFYSMGLPVPNIYGVSDDRLCYIQKDIGYDSLFDRLDDLELVKKTVSLLPDFQFATGDDFDYSFCYPQSKFDEYNIEFDLHYFKYCFLKLTGVEFDEIKLEKDFNSLKKNLLGAHTWGFMYRDFQSRNVIISADGEPFFIDFQGGRYGPVHYDVASFVWQARAAFPENVKSELVTCYLDSLKKYTDVDRVEFLSTLRHFVLFRSLQTLGAYGFRGLYEKKPHFIMSIPYALDNLSGLLDTSFDDYPYLTEVLAEIVKNKSMFSSGVEVTVPGTLTVEVNSFSYRKGVPTDLSGNGGGFVFDCRAYANPGRYERFKSMSGRDREVIDFLEEDGDITEFLESLYPVVDKHISYFISRGFDHAMFSFGCTGGRHRSVYCAERLAQHILSRFDVRVILSHKALGITEEL
ncbi:MAG: phosphotransferase [Bacteroidales bacterium]|nr:phosphotransferase [Bacteroidales bacterium]